MGIIKIFSYRFFYIASTLIFIFLISCKKFVEVDTPKNQLIEPVVFSSDATATSACMGLYSRINAAIFDVSYGGESILAGLSADEIYNTSANSDYDPFSKNSLLSNTFYISTIWTSAYRIIYYSNALLEGLSESTVISDSIKRQLSGEAKLVRAFHYFLLTNLYGDVPLVLSTDYRTNSVMPRTPQSQIYQQIIEDLKDAQTLMSDNYFNADNTVASERVRPNKFAATALLARVYLYIGDWVDAETQATTVINNTSQYSLTTDLNSVFLKNSNEVIWQIMPVLSSSNTAEGRLYNTVSSTRTPTFALTTFLESAFEPGDQRKINWTKTNISSGQPYIYPYKYKVRNTGAPYTEYNIILRLAEQYLIRAEARAHQGGASLVGAANDLNVIRTRAGLSVTTATTQSDLLNAVYHERQVELFTEWGLRWFDLKRTGLVDAVLGTEKSPNWQTTDALFPIPLSEMKYNSSLTQNPGY
jgi:hypothetical protein